MLTIKVKFSRILLLLAAFVLIALKASAQFNDTTHYHAAFAPTGSLNKTNDGRSYLLNNILKFNVKKKDATLNFTNTWVYGKQNSTLTNNDYSSTLDFDLFKTFPHFYYWGLVNYNTSYSLKINNQLLTGLGIAYSIIDKPNAYVNLSDGVLYDKSYLTLIDASMDNYHTYRNSFRLNFRFNIKDRLILDSSSFLQNSFNDSSDYIIRSITNLSFKLEKWVSLTSSLNYARQNRTRSENLLFTYGLSFEKYF